MDNVTHESVIRQLFSLLPEELNQRSLFDRYAKKLTVGTCIQIFIAAQLNNWSSYLDMETQIRAHEQWRDLFQLSSISGSQLSRKLDLIPTELLQWMFVQGVARIKKMTASHNSVTQEIGKLRLIDSSGIRLPLNVGDWAKVSKNESGVKMHLRLVVSSPDTVYPDDVVPTTKNVGDRAVAVDLVTASDATYVMDRGYDDYKRMDQWIEANIRFVIRIRDRALTTVVEEYPLPESSNIVRDAKVHVGGDFRSMKLPIRLIEFLDDKGRLYRLLTSRWDITAEEIANIYKNRWLIELYFKWIKQHLRLVKLYSYKPQAIWNQIYLSLITSLLVKCVQMKTGTPESPWRVLQLIRTFMYQSWVALMKELFRNPTRQSRGRMRAETKKSPGLRTTIGKLKPTNAKN
jgi:hypothetical protein